jgi:hypothetical protein
LFILHIEALFESLLYTKSVVALLMPLLIIMQLFIVGLLFVLVIVILLSLVAIVITTNLI